MNVKRIITLTVCCFIITLAPLAGVIVTLILYPIAMVGLMKEILGSSTDEERR